MKFDRRSFLKVLGLAPLAPVVLSDVVVPEAAVRTITGPGTVFADPGHWVGKGVVQTYQWLRDGKPIMGATGTSYTLQDEDTGTLLLQVTASNEFGSMMVVAKPSELPVHRTLIDSPDVTYPIFVGY